MSVASEPEVNDTGGNRHWPSTAARWVVTLGLAGLVVAIGIRGATPPPIVGILGAVAIVGARVRLSTPYVIAIGQIAIVAALGSTEPGPIAIAAEAVLLGGVVLPGGWSARGVRLAIPAGVTVAILGGVTAGAYLSWDVLWAAAFVTAATGGLMGYGLHRYEQVRLGVIQRE